MSSGILGYKSPFLGGSAVLSRVPRYRQVGIWQRGRLHRRKGVAEHRAERMTGQITVQQQGASATPTHPGQSETENRNYRTEITVQDRHATPSAPFGQEDLAGSCLSRGSIAYLHTVPLLAHTWPLHGVAAWGSCTEQRDSFKRRIGGGSVWTTSSQQQHNYRTEITVQDRHTTPPHPARWPWQLSNRVWNSWPHVLSNRVWNGTAA